MRKQTEKKEIEKEKGVQFISLSNRKNNKSERVKQKRVRNRRQFTKRSSTELFVRSNNLEHIPFIIESEDVCENAVDIIKDIYPIIKDDISIFMSPTFTEYTQPIEFLRWMMECYTELYEEWEITEELDKFVIRRCINYPIDAVGYSLELKFINEVSDKRMRNLLISCFSLLKKFGVPFWEHQYGIEAAEQIINDQLEEALMQKNDNRNEEEIQYLEDGLQEIKDMESLAKELDDNTVTIEQFIEAKNNYIKENEIHKDITDFFSKFEEFVVMEDSLMNYIFSFDYELEDGNPIMPYEYAQIAYNLCDSSAVGQQLNEFSTMNYNESGALPFRNEIVNEVEGVLKDFPFKYVELLNLSIKLERIFM